MSDPDDPAVQGADKAFEGPEETEGREGYVGPSARDAAGTTDEGAPPDDAGESKRRSAEDIADSEDEEGRTTEGTQGPADRPYGTTDEEGASGVDPQGSVTEGPNLPPP
jgi:hypothetical protein